MIRLARLVCRIIGHGWYTRPGPDRPYGHALEVCDRCGASRRLREAR